MPCLSSPPWVSALLRELHADQHVWFARYTNRMMKGNHYAMGTSTYSHNWAGGDVGCITRASDDIACHCTHMACA